MCRPKHFDKLEPERDQKPGATQKARPHLQRRTELLTMSHVDLMIY